MASRLPVVASDVEGVRELLGPNAAPQTVPHGDSQRLAHAISGLMLDSALATATGLENRRRAEEFFGIARTVKLYEDLWASLAQAYSSRSA
jgi:glycosyltransferase involved in cell wall biosynthesis